MIEKYLPTFLLSIITATAIWVGTSINDLNKNVSIIIERTASHEKRLDKLEQKVN